MDIKLARSPDADDAFMFYALETGKIDTGDLTFQITPEDIEVLNQKCLKGFYDVSAVSFNAYPAIAGKYALLTVGGSVGENYGPVLVATKAVKPWQLTNKFVFVPGTMTTAFLLLKLIEPSIAYSVKPFDQILDLLTAQKDQPKASLGVVIHEGQVDYASRGLHKIVDFGEWWFKECKLPLPLGANAIRRDLPADVQKRVATLIRQSIQYGLDHREKALAYALSQSKILQGQKGDDYIKMYVNEYSLDYGLKGKRAAQKLMNRAFEAGLCKELVRIDWVSPDSTPETPDAPPDETPPLEAA